MGAIESEDYSRTCVHYIYNVIRKTGQFDPACFKWKALPSDERATLRQIIIYFGDKYKVYDAQRLSLHQAGVANSVQLQEQHQAARDEIRTLREDQADFNTALIHMVQDKTDGGLDDAATTFSAMTMNLALKDRRIKELEAQNSQLRSSSNTTIPPFQGGGNPGRGGGAGRGAGRGRGRGRGCGSYRARSDGPPNSTKTGPYWPNDNYYWTHGYDCAKNHDSRSCEYQAPGHQVSATGGTPMGGSIKDKEFSK
jgi:hypothetical protein